MDTSPAEAQAHAELDEDIVLRLRRPQLEFEQGNYELSLEMYTVLLKDASDGMVNLPPPVLAKCHLNIAAILSATHRWGFALKRCGLIEDHFQDYLSDHQCIRVAYFKAVCNLKLANVREARVSTIHLFKLVKVFQEPLTDEEIKDYRDVEESVTYMEHKTYKLKLFQLVGMLERYDILNAAKYISSHKDTFITAGYPYSYYFDICCGRVHASLGQLEKALHYFTAASSCKYVPQIERNVLAMSSAFALAASRDDSCNAKAQTVYTDIMQSVSANNLHSPLLNACARNMKAYALLKCGEHALKLGNQIVAIKCFVETLLLVQVSAIDIVTDGGLWVPFRDCHCMYCQMKSALKTSTGLNHGSSAVKLVDGMNNADASDLCTVLSLCGWRDSRVTDTSIFMTAFNHLWRCYADTPETEIKQISASSQFQPRLGLWDVLCRFFAAQAYKPLPPSASGLFKMYSFSSIGGTNYRDMLSYLTMLSTRTIYPVTIEHGCDKMCSPVTYDVTMQDVNEALVLVRKFIIAELSINRSNAMKTKMASVDQILRQMLENASLVQAASRFVNSITSEMMDYLGIKPFLLTQTKPSLQFNKQVLTLHCNMDNAHYNKIWDDQIAILTESTSLCKEFVGATVFQLSPEVGATEPCTIPKAVHGNPICTTAVRTLCQLIRTLSIMYYNMGIYTWHHEDGGVTVSIRHFDCCVELNLQLGRINRLFNCSDELSAMMTMEEVEQYNILMGDVNYHLAQAILCNGGHRCANDALIAVTESINSFKSCRSDIKTRQKYAVSLKCLLHGMLKQQHELESCISEIPALITVPFEDAIVEVENIKAKVKQIWPELYHSVIPTQATFAAQSATRRSSLKNRLDKKQKAKDIAENAHLQSHCETIAKEAITISGETERINPRPLILNNRGGVVGGCTSNSSENSRITVTQFNKWFPSDDVDLTIARTILFVAVALLVTFLLAYWYQI